jgi:hypothetical protein
MSEWALLKHAVPAALPHSHSQIFAALMANNVRNSPRLKA